MRECRAMGTSLGRRCQTADARRAKWPLGREPNGQSERASERVPASHLGRRKRKGRAPSLLTAGRPARGSAVWAAAARRIFWSQEQPQLLLAGLVVASLTSYAVYSAQYTTGPVHAAVRRRRMEIVAPPALVHDRYTGPAQLAFPGKVVRWTVPSAASTSSSWL